jgi:hypothetical protein
MVVEEFRIFWFPLFELTMENADPRAKEMSAWNLGYFAYMVK